MKSNPILNAAIYEIVDNQLCELTPPETKQTLARLFADGFSLQEARRLIACVVVSEIFDVLKQQKPYNATRFIQALHQLPQLP